MDSNIDANQNKSIKWLKWVFFSIAGLGYSWSFTIGLVFAMMSNAHFEFLLLLLVPSAYLAVGFLLKIKKFVIWLLALILGILPLILGIETAIQFMPIDKSSIMFGLTFHPWIWETIIGLTIILLLFDKETLLDFVSKVPKS